MLKEIVATISLYTLLKCILCTMYVYVCGWFGVMYCTKKKQVEHKSELPTEYLGKQKNIISTTHIIGST